MCPVRPTPASQAFRSGFKVTAPRRSLILISPSGVAAARQALDRRKTGVFLTARTEGFIVGRPDLDETIRRLTAFAEAAPIACMRPGSAATRKSSPSFGRSRPCRSTCWSEHHSPPLPGWRRSVCGGSASAARWRDRHGPDFSALPANSQRTILHRVRQRCPVPGDQRNVRRMSPRHGAPEGRGHVMLRSGQSYGYVIFRGGCRFRLIPFDKVAQAVATKSLREVARMKYPCA